MIICAAAAAAALAEDAAFGVVAGDSVEVGVVPVDDMTDAVGSSTRDGLLTKESTAITELCVEDTDEEGDEVMEGEEDVVEFTDGDCDMAMQGGEDEDRVPLVSNSMVVAAAVPLTTDEMVGLLSVTATADGGCMVKGGDGDTRGAQR